MTTRLLTTVALSALLFGAGCKSGTGGSSEAKACGSYNLDGRWFARVDVESQLQDFDTAQDVIPRFEFWVTSTECAVDIFGVAMLAKDDRLVVDNYYLFEPPGMTVEQTIKGEISRGGGEIVIDVSFLEIDTTDREIWTFGKLEIVQ